MSQEKGYTRLVSHGIKPSLQRIAIMNYLIENRIHPTVAPYQDLLTPFSYPQVNK